MSTCFHKLSISFTSRFTLIDDNTEVEESVVGSGALVMPVGGASVGHGHPPSVGTADCQGLPCKHTSHSTTTVS